MILNTKLTTMLIIGCMLTPSAIAATSYPRGCEVSGFGFSDPGLILNDTGTQKYFLLQNRFDMPIELERVESDDVFMSPKLQCKLSTNNWAAFASDVQNVYFNCFSIVNNERMPIKCSEVINICEYPRAKFPLSNMGNYWISTNKSQQQVITDSARKGILLKW